MARILDTSVTSNGNTDIDWKPARKETPNRATLYVYGTFGSGTASLLVSPDGGGTYINVTDSLGNNIAFTANGVVNFELYGNGDPIANKTVKLRLTLAGATSPDLNYVIDDVR